MSSQEQNEHFLAFAKLLVDEIQGKYAWVEPFQGDGSEMDDLYMFIAHRIYDLMRLACVSISNAQMQQGGVRLHPNAMLRAIPDPAELPPTTESS